MHFLTKHIPYALKKKWMPLASRLYRWRPRLRSRNFHAYCVGTPKSGTTSVARIFSPNFQAAHEPRTFTTNDYIADWLEGVISDRELTNFLQARDRHLWLELEAAHVLHHCVDLLVRAFPSARFILTIRDCFTWLNSEINQHYIVRDTPPWGRLQRLRYASHANAYTDHDEVLRTYGLYPIESYLAYWARHNRQVLDSVPDERLFVLQTSAIDTSLSDLASFVGVSPHQLDASHAHSYSRSDKELDVFKLVDPTYIHAVARKHCRPLMKRFFDRKL